jgi:hypothetical protein
VSAVRTKPRTAPTAREVFSRPLHIGDVAQRAHASRVARNVIGSHKSRAHTYCV